MMQNSRNHLIRDMALTSLLSLVTGVIAAFGLALLVLLSGQAGAAEQTAAESDAVSRLPSMTIDQVQRGSLLLKLVSPGGENGLSVDAPLLYTDVAMQVSGMVNRVHVRQQFHNPGQGWVEGVYVFPLPENAAVDRMRLRIGERVIEGEIHEKGQAQKIYTAALQSGRKASLLSQQRPNIFTTKVANIGPDERVDVEIEYQQDLRYEAGQFSLRFPMVVAPRYIPGTPLVGEENLSGFQGSGWAQDTDRVSDASQITPPVADPAEGTINPVSIRIELDAGMPLARLESRYHAVQIEDAGPGGKLIRLVEQNVPADRDFELVWAPSIDQAPRGALFTEQWQGGEYALLMVMPPRAAENGVQAMPRELVFVVDTSGSMHGESIVQARAALKLALSRLSPADRFNVIQFNNTASGLFSQAVDASSQNIRRALRYVDSLQANGGTEMLSALQLSLDGREQTGHLRQVVFLTDGSVGNEDELFRTIEQRLGSSRLFTVGIGSAPNSFFMTRAAAFGRGTFTYIGNVSEVQEKMGTLFSKLESPLLTDIRVDWPDGAEVEMWPARIPDLYLGEPVVLAARLTQQTQALQLSGRLNGQPWQQRIALSGGAQSEGVRVIWARRKIADLMDQGTRGRSEDEVRRDVLAVALEHKLVSRYTSLVAVDKTPSRPANEPVANKPLPTNLPKGWDAAKVFGSMPRTATAAPLHLLLGLSFLLAGWLVGLRRAGAGSAAATATGQERV